MVMGAGGGAPTDRQLRYTVEDVGIVGTGTSGEIMHEEIVRKGVMEVPVHDEDDF